MPSLARHPRGSRDPDPAALLKMLDDSIFEDVPWRFFQHQANSNARFEPSKSIRDHILDRLNEQDNCLVEIAARVEDRQKLAEEGKVNGGGRSPGDVQIDGAKIARMKVEARIKGGIPILTKEERNTERSLFEDLAKPSSSSNQHGIWKPMDRSRRLKNRFQPVTEEDEKDEDPMQKFLRLEYEIRVLAKIGTKPHKDSDPSKVLAERLEAMSDPYKALEKQLSEVLGPAGKTSGSHRSGVSAPATQDSN